MQSEIYLDHAATSPPYDQVVERMHEVAKMGNPSSAHRRGRMAQEQLRQARQQIADALEVEASSVLFTSGATEANNLAIYGTLAALNTRPKHLITSRIEHPSVLEPIRDLERKGWSVTYLPCSSSGLIDPNQFAQAIRSDTVFASMMLVNNETGIIQRIRSMAEVARAKKVVFHCDAVQGFGKIEVRPERLGVNLLTVSGHKIRGPRGVGMLLRSSTVQLEPMIRGGGQEFALRPGTENCAGILGFALAIQLALQDQEQNVKKLKERKKRLWHELRTRIPRILRIGSADDQNSVPQILCVGIPEHEAASMIRRLDHHGLAIASGSACHSGSSAISPVLQAMDVDPNVARGMLRFSMTPDQPIEQLVEAAEIVKRVMLE